MSPPIHSPLSIEIVLNSKSHLCFQILQSLPLAFRYKSKHCLVTCQTLHCLANLHLIKSLPTLILNTRTRSFLGLITWRVVFPLRHMGKRRVKKRQDGDNLELGPTTEAWDQFLRLLTACLAFVITTIGFKTCLLKLICSLKVIALKSNGIHRYYSSMGDSHDWGSLSMWDGILSRLKRLSDSRDKYIVFSLKR